MTTSKSDRAVAVELVYDKDCPNVGATRANLRAALRQLGIPDRWTEWETSSPGTPEPLRKLGSPTVLVNGRDAAGTTAAGGACCRLYETEGGRQSGVPPADLIEKALAEAKLATAEELKLAAPSFRRE